VKGLSENITVKSIVGRYLEHSRIYYFYNNGEEEVYLSSADLMPRNLDRRVEATFPILDKNLKNVIINNILKIYLQDNTQARFLNENGGYYRLKANDEEPRICVQEYLMKNVVLTKDLS
jgi:polyphosphate kinase